MAKAKIERVDGNLYIFKAELSDSEKKRKAEILFQEGLRAEDSFQLDVALASYQRAIAFDPCAAGALVNIGTIFYHRRNFNAAVEYYRKAIDVDPCYALAHYNLGNALEELGSCVNALEHYARALQIDPGYADAHFNLALLYADIDSTSNAITHWRAYLKYAPGDAGFWRERATRELSRLMASSF